MQTKKMKKNYWNKRKKKSDPLFLYFVVAYKVKNSFLICSEHPEPIFYLLITRIETTTVRRRYNSFTNSQKPAPKMELNSSLNQTWNIRCIFYTKPFFMAVRKLTYSMFHAWKLPIEFLMSNEKKYAQNNVMWK